MLRPQSRRGQGAPLAGSSLWIGKKGLGSLKGWQLEQAQDQDGRPGDPAGGTPSPRKQAGAGKEKGSCLSCDLVVGGACLLDGPVINA